MLEPQWLLVLSLSCGILHGWIRCPETNQGTRTAADESDGKHHANATAVQAADIRAYDVAPVPSTVC